MTLSWWARVFLIPVRLKRVKQRAELIDRCSAIDGLVHLLARDMTAPQSFSWPVVAYPGHDHLR